jgi:hypothetical protein
LEKEEMVPIKIPDFFAISYEKKIFVSALLSREELQQMTLIKTICRTFTNNKLSGAQIFYHVLGLFSSR